MSADETDAPTSVRVVRYTESRQVLGADLTPGMWLDSLDHRGARMVWSVSFPGNYLKVVIEEPSGWDAFRLVGFSDLPSDRETVRADLPYDVVDPDSMVETYLEIEG